MLNKMNPIILKKMSNEKSYLEQVKDWLDADPRVRTIEQGAKLMLQGNRNRILHQNVIHRSNFEKVEYELKKIIGDQRLIEPVADFQELETKVSMIEKSLETMTVGGKRPDHDSLPENIQVLVEKNVSIYHEMRSRFEKLKVLSEDGHTAEERLPFLNELLELEARLTFNWTLYDHFDVNAPIPTDKKPIIIPGEKIDAKRVSANRKFLSDNKSKMVTLIESGETDKMNALLEKMQLRYNELIQNGETFAPDQVTNFKALGLIVGEVGERNTGTIPGEQIQTEGSEDILPAGENQELGKESTDSDSEGENFTAGENVNPGIGE